VGGGDDTNFLGCLPLSFFITVGEFRKNRHPRNVKLTKFLRHVFQVQETHDFRKPVTCEASNSRMCEVRES
jgi:hypothetical protein